MSSLALKSRGIATSHNCPWNLLDCIIWPPELKIGKETCQRSSVELMDIFSQNIGLSIWAGPVFRIVQIVITDGR